MKKENIIVVVFYAAMLFLVGYMVYTFAYSSGYRAGSDATSAIHAESECRFNYGHKPVSEVPARCAKYFEIEK